MAQTMSSLPETRASLLLRLPDADDRAAWDEFINIYGRAVYRGARRLGLQAADAEDLVQEVFSRVARSIAAWLERDDRGPFRAWLFTISRNTAINLLTRSRFRPAGGDEANQTLKELPDSDQAVSDQLEREYRRELFRWASEKVRPSFTESTWRAFWLAGVEHQPAAEVAKQLGLSVGSVYIAKSRVIARMRDVVQKFAAEGDE